jgi:transcriptional regulator with XRE-family HTH domain
MADLLDAIREAIDASGETRYVISKRSGVSQAQLSRLAHGQQGVSIVTAERLADALDLEIILRPKRRTRRKGV